LFLSRAREVQRIRSGHQQAAGSVGPTRIRMGLNGLAFIHCLCTTQKAFVGHKVASNKASSLASL
jgi:hypothetical protein